MSDISEAELIRDLEGRATERLTENFIKGVAASNLTSDQIGQVAGHYGQAFDVMFLALLKLLAVSREWDVGAMSKEDYVRTHSKILFDAIGVAIQEDVAAVEEAREFDESSS